MQSRYPILVMGIATRSGSTYVRNCIGLHSAAHVPPHLNEDFFAYESEHLERFRAALLARGPRIITEPVGEGQSLLSCIGRGLVTFAAQAAPPSTHVVLKTPSPRNLEFARKLFPGAPIVVVLRDLRDVVASQVKAKHATFSAACARVAMNTELLCNALDVHTLASGSPATQMVSDVLCVRYESLYSQAEREHVTRILTYCGLSPAEYDFDALKEIPVWGTSWGSGAAHHDVLSARDANFTPHGRWKSQWDSAAVEHFEHVCGFAMRRLGYSLHE